MPGSLPYPGSSLQQQRTAFLVIHAEALQCLEWLRTHCIVKKKYRQDNHRKCHEHLMSYTRVTEHFMMKCISKF